MEEPKSTFPKQRRNKTVISLGKAGGGGGGIGVGIIFLGGAVASATAAFLIRRRLQKSTNNTENCNRHPPTPSAEIPYKLLEDKNTNQVKGLKFIAPDSDSPACTDAHRNLSNGTAKTGMRENDNTVASDQSFIQDQKYKIEANDGKGDPVSDSEQLVHSYSPGGLVSSLQFDTSPLKEEESPLPMVGNQMLFQPKHVADRFSGGEIEIIQEDDPVDAALVDQGTEKEKQKLENSNGEEMEIDCCSDKDMGELKSQDAAETTKIEHRTGTLLQSREEREYPFRCVQERESTGNLLATKDQRPESEECSLAFETVEVIEKVEAPDAAIVGQGKGDTMTQMNVVHGSPCTEILGVYSRNEKLEASHEDQGRGNAQILMLAEEENKCDRHDRSLNIGADEETKGTETLEAIDLDEHRGTLTSMSEKGQRKCPVGSPATETTEVKEKVEMKEEAEARDTEVISCEESRANGESAQFPHNIASASCQQKLPTEKPGIFLNVDHEDISVSNELTSEDKTCENFSCLLKPEIGSDDGFTELQLSAKAAETRKENIVNEPASEDRAIESENSPMQLVEIQQNLNGDNGKQLEEVERRSQVNYAHNVTIEEHNQTRPEEDGLNDEGDDDADEANMTGKVEEGTGDSSVESNAEPIWPMDSLEEVSAEVKQLKINGKKEEQHMEDDQNVRTRVPTYPQNIDNDGIIDNSIRKGNDRKSNSKLTLLERVMLELAEQTHQPTYPQKLRILIPIMLAFSWSFCFWQFGPPFLKISLILVLIKVLSKIQGF